MSSVGIIDINLHEIKANKAPIRLKPAVDQYSLLRFSKKKIALKPCYVQPSVYRVLTSKLVVCFLLKLGVIYIAGLVVTD